jgi:hypothetical protein
VAQAPSAAAALALVGCELFEPTAPTERIAAHPAAWLARSRAAGGPSGDPYPFTFIINFMNPGSAVTRAPPLTNMVLYFQSRDGATLPQLLAAATPLGACLRRYVGADAAQRAGMLKIIADVQEGPFLLRAAAPRTPVLIGRHLRTAVHAPPDGSYLEVCASMHARMHAPRQCAPFPSDVACARRGRLIWMWAPPASATGCAPPALNVLTFTLRSAL